MTDQPQTIEVYYGNLALDLGATSIPRMLARFWPYLEHDGTQLADWEYAVLLQVLILRDDQDFELRAENLPLRSSTFSIERAKAKLRKMGLVFTKRIYYPARPGKPPAMRCQQWDMRSLFYNLALIARRWVEENNRLTDQWALKGRKGKKPIYTFPVDFKHSIVLPADIALDLVRGEFFPAPAEWKKEAIKQLGTVDLPTAHVVRGRQTSPIAQETRGRAPTAHPERGHLIKRDSTDSDLRLEEEEKGTPPQELGTPIFDSDPLVSGVFVEFANRCNDPKYRPSQKEQRAVQALLTDGFGLETEILPGIEKAFARAKTPPRTFMYCVRVIRQNRIETSSNDYANISVQPPGIAPDLASAAEILPAAGHEINEPILARLRLMADRADKAARSAGSTGAQWLSDALRTGLGVAQDSALINYADSVLASWIQNGKPQPKRPSPKKGRKHARTPVAAPASRSGRWPSDSD